MTDTAIIGHICSECAHKRGWTWPHGTRLVCYKTKCLDCCRKTYCQPAEDWNQTGSTAEVAD